MGIIIQFPLPFFQAHLLGLSCPSSKRLYVKQNSVHVALQSLQRRLLRSRWASRACLRAGVRRHFQVFVKKGSGVCDLPSPSCWPARLTKCPLIFGWQNQHLGHALALVSESKHHLMVIPIRGPGCDIFHPDSGKVRATTLPSNVQRDIIWTRAPSAP